MFGQHPENLYFCPGRVNLIGEHTDYNGGFVLPCALDSGTWLMIAPNKLGKLRFRSISENQQVDLPISDNYQKNNDSWCNYPLGVIQQLQGQGFQITGYDLLYYGTMPIGAGLSSSASIEVVTAFALNELLGGQLSRIDLAKLAQRAENDFIGVNSGIMDQFAVVLGDADHAILLNCKTLSYRQVYVPLEGYRLVIINSNKPRQLANSAYNDRVRECQQALKYLQNGLNIESLSDIDSQTLSEFRELIVDPVIWKRARHIVEENERVHLAAQALIQGDMPGFGKLLNMSHISLKELYEVSGLELDALAEYSRHYKGVLGAKMTGAGFGGCIVALVKSETVLEYQANLTEYYKLRTGYDPSFYFFNINDGVKKSINNTDFNLL